jgi:predicted dithiol-disulfide oxidoreductase (DUF899 family)
MTPTLEADTGSIAETAASCQTDPAEFLQEAPGISAFTLSDGTVYHTYSAYARGLDGLWGAYQWLDRARWDETRAYHRRYGDVTTNTRKPPPGRPLDAMTERAS